MHCQLRVLKEMQVTLGKKSLLSLVAGAALLLGTQAASAAVAYASNELNVRSGPGTGYGVVDVLVRGEAVDVNRCSGTWCFVEKSGADGWVSAKYLMRDAYAPDRDDDDVVYAGDGYDDEYYDDYYDEYDDYDDGFYIQRRHRPYVRTGACFGAPNARVCISN